MPLPDRTEQECVWKYRDQETVRSLLRIRQFYASLTALTVLSSMRKIRLFISSPGDVGEERRITEATVERLQFRYAGRVHFEACLWEHLPMRASAGFQEQIPHPSEFDIVVMILWSRIGTRLSSDVRRADGTSYASGTEFEFEDAVAAAKRLGRLSISGILSCAPTVAMVDKGFSAVSRSPARCSHGRLGPKSVSIFRQPWRCNP